MLKNPNEFDKGKTIVYFVRHGERVHIPNSRGIGLEIPGPGLTNVGKKQAKKVAREFVKMKGEIDCLYCSDMARAIETAEEIGKTINKKPIVVKNLAEYDSSVWTGKIYKRKFWKNYFKSRKSIKAFDNLLEKNKGKVIVLVVHGNVIKGLIWRKANLSLKKSGMFHHNYCYISVARYIGKRIDHICCYNSNTVNHSSL